MAKINILITGIGSSNSLSFIKGLRKQDEIDVTIIGTDIYEKEFSAGAYFVDKFYKVPCAADPQFAVFLLKICKENNVHIVVPVIDEEFIPISSARDDFGRINVEIMLPDYEQVLDCHDKFRTYQFLTKNGFPTPKTWIDIPESPKYPLLMKPRSGRGSKGVKTIYDANDIERRNKTVEYIYQEMINGKEFTIDTLSGRDGKILAVVPRIRLETKNGNSTKSITVKNTDVEEICIDICETLGLKGPANLQCMVADDGTPYFFEINSRIGSAVVLTIQAGINIPLLAVKDILGMKVEKMVGRFKENVVMLRYWDEVFTLAQIT